MGWLPESYPSTPSKFVINHWYPILLLFGSVAAMQLLPHLLNQHKQSVEQQQLNYH